MIDSTYPTIAATTYGSSFQVRHIIHSNLEVHILVYTRTSANDPDDLLSFPIDLGFEEIEDSLLLGLVRRLVDDGGAPHVVHVGHRDSGTGVSCGMMTPRRIVTTTTTLMS